MYRLRRITGCVLYRTDTYNHSETNRHMLIQPSLTDYIRLLVQLSLTNIYWYHWWSLTHYLYGYWHAYLGWFAVVTSLLRHLFVLQHRTWRQVINTFPYQQEQHYKSKCVWRVGGAMITLTLTLYRGVEQLYLDVIAGRVYYLVGDRSMSQLHELLMCLLHILKVVIYKVSIMIW